MTFKTFQAYKIDPAAKTIEPVTLSRGDWFQQAYGLMNCDMIEFVHYGERFMVAVDEEGYCRNSVSERGIFRLHGRPLAGIGLLIENDRRGEPTDITVPIGAVCAAVAWIDVAEAARMMRAMEDHIRQEHPEAIIMSVVPSLEAEAAELEGS